MNASTEQTDDDWRAEHFTEEQLAGNVIASRSSSGREPGFEALCRALDKYGPEGILESAIHLPREQYEKLEKKVKAASGKKGKR